MVGSYEKPFKQEWGFHTAKVNCVSWAPNSIYVASGGLDCSIIIWSLDLPDKHLIMRNAHDQVKGQFLLRNAMPLFACLSEKGWRPPFAKVAQK